MAPSGEWGGSSIPRERSPERAVSGGSSTVRPDALEDHRPAPLAKPVAPPVVSPPLVDIIFEEEHQQEREQSAAGLQVEPPLDGPRQETIGDLMSSVVAEFEPQSFCSWMSPGPNARGSGTRDSSPVAVVELAATVVQEMMEKSGAPLAATTAAANAAIRPARGSSPVPTAPAAATSGGLARLGSVMSWASLGGSAGAAASGGLGKLGSMLSEGIYGSGKQGKPSRQGSAMSAGRPKLGSRQGSVASSNHSRRRSWMSRPSSQDRAMSGLTMFSLRRTFESTPGCLADHYTVERRLGSGAFGDVKVAISHASGDKVAVKSIPVAKSRVFEREYEIAKRLKHPCIVRLYDIFKDPPGEANAMCHLCMELCKGGDLLSFVRCHEERTVGGVLYMPPRTETVAHYMWQSMRAIDYLHHHCIAHRDIKAENFLRMNRNEGSKIKLIDFGLSEHFMFGKRMHDRVGTLGYCAPETMIPGPLGYTELCDIWSSGILYYLLFIGEYPVLVPRGSSMRDAHRITVETEIDFQKGAWKAHPPEAIEFVRNLLRREPLERPPARDLLTDTWLREVGRQPEEGEEGTKCCCCPL
mmetsp:Transcript_38594/g.90681  ORF Transcript_38594/g.90681 Transcript_38594/m.90681 type:complete len:583 (-) Transcript_38594:55-1803(-)